MECYLFSPPNPVLIPFVLPVMDTENLNLAYSALIYKTSIVGWMRRLPFFSVGEESEIQAVPWDLREFFLKKQNDEMWPFLELLFDGLNLHFLPHLSHYNGFEQKREFWSSDIRWIIRQRNSTETGPTLREQTGRLRKLAESMSTEPKMAPQHDCLTVCPTC